MTVTQIQETLVGVYRDLGAEQYEHEEDGGAVCFSGTHLDRIMNTLDEAAIDLDIRLQELRTAIVSAGEAII
jgi:hypothetical protein